MSAKGKGKKLSKYCRIFLYIADRNPELAEVISHLCMEGALSPGRMGVGITFLFPEKKTSDEIIKKAYNGEEEDAVKIIQSLILPDIFATAQDFKNKPVGSRLGIKIDVEGVEKNKVNLKGGVVLKESSFVALGRENLSVWDVEKGTIPTAGDPYRPPVKVRGGESDKDPSSRGKVVHLRREIAQLVSGMAYRRFGAWNKREFDPYLGPTVSILSFIEEYYNDLFVQVLPLIDFSPMATFFIILEPYKADNYIISNQIIEEWGNVPCVVAPKEKYLKYLGMASKMVKFSSDDLVKMKIDIFERIKNDGVLNKTQTAPEVNRTYKNFVNNGKINGYDNVLPRIVNIPYEYKLWQDALRYIIHAADMRNETEFQDLLEHIAQQYTGDSFDSIQFISEKRIKSDVSDSTLIRLCMFMLSSDFLYVPVKLGGDRDIEVMIKGMPLPFVDFSTKEYEKLSLTHSAGNKMSKALKLLVKSLGEVPE